MTSGEYFVHFNQLRTVFVFGFWETWIENSLKLAQTLLLQTALIPQNWSLTTCGTKLLVIGGSSQLATLKELATSSKAAHVMGFHGAPNQSGL